jgi:hypothetical protein
MKFQKFTPKTKQLAKILSGGRSSPIVDLMQSFGNVRHQNFTEGVPVAAGG